MPKPAECLLLLLFVGFVLPGSADSAVIVDTGPGPNDLSGLVLGWDDDLSQAAQFSISSPYTITSVQGWMFALENDGLATAVLYTDGGEVPGLELFSAPFAVSGSVPDWFGPVGLNWSLAAGTYWVGFEVRSPSTLVGVMPHPSITPLADEAYRTQGVWSQLDDSNLGVQVFGDPPSVPEPSSVGVLMLGVGLAIAKIRASR
jgi:hypothetical protein